MRSHSKYKPKGPGRRDGADGAWAIPWRPPHGSVATRSVRGRVHEVFVWWRSRGAALSFEIHERCLRGAADFL